MLRSALLYTALLFGANAAFAGAVDWQAAKDAGLVKLVPAEEPAPVSDVEFTDPKGGTHTLADYKGKVVLLNFWATWCAPCREEMPTLAKLQEELGDEGVRVATIATGRNDPVEIERFLEEVGAGDLPGWRDPSQELARDMGVLGLPVTVILNREGQEVARLTGDADWSSESALAILRAIAAEGAEG